MRNKAYTLINVSGLVMGLACCIILTLFVRSQTGYDSYQLNKENIYRLTTNREDLSSGERYTSGASVPVPVKSPVKSVFACSLVSEKFKLKKIRTFVEKCGLAAMASKLRRIGLSAKALAIDSGFIQKSYGMNKLAEELRRVLDGAQAIENCSVILCEVTMPRNRYSLEYGGYCV